MKKRSKQNSVILDPPKDLDEFGKRLVRLGEALQDENTLLRDLCDLSSSCGLLLNFLLIPKRTKQ